jgi:hypothetical protein
VFVMLFHQSCVSLGLRWRSGEVVAYWPGDNDFEGRLQYMIDAITGPSISLSQARSLIDRTPRQVLHYLRRRLTKRERLQAFDDKHSCVFVLSTGRVGTKTLAALFGLAENVLAYHEPKPTLYGLSRLSYDYCTSIPVRKVLQEAFLATRRQLMNYSLDCGKGYVETSPQVTFLAPVIIEAVPQVRFIHLVRDPRHVVRSGMRRKWYAGHPADKTRIVPPPGSEAERRWQSYNAFQKNLWLWDETNRWILEFSSSLPTGRILLVHSENVFDGREETLGQLFTFVGASMPAERGIRSVLAKKLNVQNTGTFPEPSDWSAEMRNDLAEIAGETARTLGYEL